MTLLLVILARPAQAVLMKSGDVEISRSLLASAGASTHIIAPPAGHYLPRSLFFVHQISNDLYIQGGGVRLTLPENSLPKDFFVFTSPGSVSHTPGINPDDIQIANQKAKAQSGSYRQPIAGSLLEITPFDTDGNKLDGRFPKPATISLAFTNNVKDGVLEGTTPKIRVGTLSLWTLDPEKKLWRNLQGSSVDILNKRVTAKIQNLGIYAIMGAPDFSLDQVIVYPIPWRPHSGNPLTGNETDGISFDLLPSECTIQIFTISGELVREIQHSGGDSIEKWDVRTSGGESVASGLYVYLIKTSSGHKVGKLIVIR